MLTDKIEQHPKYPFIQIGPTEAFFRVPDIESPDTILAYDTWYLRVDDDIRGCYESREQAISSVESVVFCATDDYVRAREQIKKALESNNIELALILSEGIGRAKGIVEAQSSLRNTLRTLQENLNQALDWLE